ncbi:hypothetical protein AURDEDRAFT_119243 [Auricularia subglabra TFB-10046 SS5]|nr:hypothetical protein AURDEDRAFT_119243 [Auricularia subglabra TFB-10046 SS5]
MLFRTGLYPVPRNIIQQKRAHRVPLASYFANMEPGNLAKTSFVWLTIRPFYLRLLAMISLWGSRGFHRDQWRCILKGLVRNDDAYRILRLLGVVGCGSVEDSLAASTSPSLLQQARTLGEDDVPVDNPSDESFFARDVLSDSPSRFDGVSSSTTISGGVTSTRCVCFSCEYLDEPVEGETRLTEDHRGLVALPSVSSRSISLMYFRETTSGVMELVQPADVNIDEYAVWDNYGLDRVLLFHMWTYCDIHEASLEGEKLLKQLLFLDAGGTAFRPSRRIWMRRRGHAPRYAYGFTQTPISNIVDEEVMGLQVLPGHVTNAAESRVLSGEEDFAVFRSYIDQLGVNFEGFSLPPFHWKLTKWLDDGLQALVVWELAELEFRHELFALDELLRALYPDALELHGIPAQERRSQLSACFGWGDLKPDLERAGTFSASSGTSDTYKALRALFEFMTVWPRSEDFLRIPSSGWEEDMVDALAEAVWRFYVQTYYDYRCQYPPMPREKPYISTPESITTEDEDLKRS